MLSQTHLIAYFRCTLWLLPVLLPVHTLTEEWKACLLVLILNWTWHFLNPPFQSVLHHIDWKSLKITLSICRNKTKVSEKYGKKKGKYGITHKKTQLQKHPVYNKNIFRSLWTLTMYENIEVKSVIFSKMSFANGMSIRAGKCQLHQKQKGINYCRNLTKNNCVEIIGSNKNWEMYSIRPKC